MPAGHYYFSDHLGSTDLVTDALGTMSACPGNPSLISGEEESDYYPFGGERVLCDRGIGNNYKFTGKERDSETGLDEFGARYYSSFYGRFTIPDWATAPTAVPYAKFGDPQSLNLYSYVENEPVNRADADGHCPDGCPIDPPQSLAELDQRNADTADFSIGALKGAVNFGTSLENTFITMGQSTDGPIPQLQPSNQMQAVGMTMGMMGMTAVSSLAEAPAAASTIQQNAAKSEAFEQAVVSSTKATDSNVARQVTLKTESGVKTKMDVVSTKASGEVRLQEAKSSATARLTRNQAAAHPEIAKTGATVVGQGKPAYPGGTKIPPTKVQITRPPKS